LPSNARAAYQDTSLTTAPQGRLLTMLYDRLARDLLDAIEAAESRDLYTANQSLGHAQQIVAVLNEALDLTAWPDGRGLAAIYQFLREHLVSANVGKDVAAMRDCLAIVEPLADAWHQAYASAPGARSTV
jgi:flagellar protein FliS